MSDDFAPIEQLATSLLHNLGAAERRKVLRSIARDVRNSQSTRIARQLNPDGSPFEPRKAQKKGRIRRKTMFRKLRLARYLRAGATADEAWIGFAGRAARIARVHQEGLADKPAPGMKKVRYARRILLGLTGAERVYTLDLIIANLLAP